MTYTPITNIKPVQRHFNVLDRLDPDTELVLLVNDHAFEAGRFGEITEIELPRDPNSGHHLDANGEETGILEAFLQSQTREPGTTIEIMQMLDFGQGVKLIRTPFTFDGAWTPLAVNQEPIPDDIDLAEIRDVFDVSTGAKQ